MKIDILRNDDFATWRFNSGLIRELVARDHQVRVLCPPGAYTDRIKSLGATHVPVALDPLVSPLSDARLLVSLFELFRTHRPDLVHTCAMKPNLYGVMAARAAGVKNIVALICGLGHLYNENPGWQFKAISMVVDRAYRRALALTDRVWFLNDDDRSFFVGTGRVEARKAVLIRSEGVSLEEFSPNTVTPDAVAALRTELSLDSTRVALMIARPSWSKGVREFVEASRSFAASNICFLLVGRKEPIADVVPEEWLRKNESSVFRWLAQRSDIAELLALCDVAVLPSYYREGVPRSLLEAAAMGRAIVTTDSVGCREVVEHGRNGYLVPTRDANSLASAIAQILANEPLRREFGRQSRLKAEAEFDEKDVVRRVITELYGLQT